MSLKVVHLSLYNIANIPYLLSRGLCKFTDATSVCITTYPKYRFGTYLEYPEEYAIGWNIEWPEVIDYIQQADIIHIHDHLSALFEAAELDEIPLQEILSYKDCIILHGHGTFHRMHKSTIGSYRETLKFTDIVATPDLLSYYPQATYIPSPTTNTKYYNNNHLQVSFSHSPTERFGKTTHYLENIIIPSLSSELGYEIPLHLITKQSHSECLRIKSTTSFNFDQLLVGTYGVGVQECLNQGIIPLVRISQSTNNFLNTFMQEQHPFLLVTNSDEQWYQDILTQISLEATQGTEEELTEKLLQKQDIVDLNCQVLDLIRDTERQKQIREYGKQWFERHHSQKASALYTYKLYKQLKG